ncbi:uncharacterized protein F5891DRAFT_982455 [Suillus fuscotomentosus]|uniref:Uncharacterized protein n=1 Tax=Suillus fuscotomentosus TaxID=1912939 RepID=A0AAD4E3A9_9AGAM|nr:uncharacterized protein F5891DRAFT_982455 [Suillus fuscotomentosus]KAG1897724.1 hypothetical protein F5891DRAFT_982455 [Suillus fuscotomentosus]
MPMNLKVNFSTTKLADWEGRMSRHQDRSLSYQPVLPSHAVKMHRLPSQPAHLACQAQNKLSSKWKAKKKAHPTEVHSLTHRSPSIPALTYAGGSKTCSPTIPTIAIDNAIDAISGADADGEVWTEEDVLAAFSICPLDALDDVAGEDDDAFSDTFTSDFTDDSDDPDAAKEMGKCPSKGTGNVLTNIELQIIGMNLKTLFENGLMKQCLGWLYVPLHPAMSLLISVSFQQSLTHTVHQFGSSVKLNKGQGADRKKQGFCKFL